MQTHLNDNCPKAPNSAKTKSTEILESPVPSINETSSQSFVTKKSKKNLKTFKLPNRKKLANELLDDVFDEVKAECNEQILQAKSLTIVSDGWSDINRESVQNFVIYTPKPLFFDAIYSGDESHIAIWVAEKIIQQMNIIGCNSHIINLLIGDILKIDQIKTVMKNAKKLYLHDGARTHLTCLQSIQKSKTAIEQALMDTIIHQNIDSTLQNYVL
ncbi:uncharacterized protein LOC113214128 [Rhizophagus clarus]|uniref:Uncharacterized protein LOC113214128 n=1 Tax=Rhizophagus clarus TaxID=94130 RepID=A0A8H3LAZ7_9GLOM|nr:uncharacterized protein LOC113214128 [Rhizophagus clarus]